MGYRVSVDGKNVIVVTCDPMTALNTAFSGLSDGLLAKPDAESITVTDHDGDVYDLTVRGGWWGCQIGNRRVRVAEALRMANEAAAALRQMLEDD